LWQRAARRSAVLEPFKNGDCESRRLARAGSGLTEQVDASQRTWNDADLYGCRLEIGSAG
jgi:hypothetical protein